MTNPMFDVTATSTQPVTLEKSRRQKFAFTVSSRSDMTVKAILQAQPLTNQDMPRGSAETLGTLDPGWLKVTTEPAEPASPGGGPLVASFKPKETRQVTVEAAVPPIAPPGQYRFRLAAALENDPVATSCPSAPVTFVIAGEPAQKKGHGLLIGLIIGAVVLLIGIVALIFALKSDSDEGMVEVPNVVGLDYPIAVTKLVVKDLTPFNAKSTSSDQAPNTVLSQTPEAGEMLEKDGVVELEIAVPMVTVPADIVGQTLAAATTRLAGMKLGIQVDKETVTGKPATTVLKVLDPPADQKVAQDTVVHVEVEGKGVAVPGLEGQQFLDAVQALQKAGLTLGEVTEKADKTKTTNTVARQVPAKNSPVALGTKVNLEVWTQPGTLIDVVRKNELMLQNLGTFGQVRTAVGKTTNKRARPTRSP